MDHTNQPFYIEAWSTDDLLYGPQPTTQSAPSLSTDPDIGQLATKGLAVGTIAVDEAQGIVEAFAAAIGNKDSVGDVIAPTAFNASLKRRTPRVVWGHNWNEPVGKVLEIREVPPSDPRLPLKMRSAGVGGLYVKVQFNLASERGREAFASVAFFGEDQEWSIGYKTIQAEFSHSLQANLLKEVELYEISPVLHGANQLTGTVSVKSELNAVAQPQPTPASSGILARRLSMLMMTPAKIRYIQGQTILFDTAAGTFMTEMSSEEGGVTLSPPRQVRIRILVEPILKEDACGKEDRTVDIEVATIEDLEQKAGRVIASRNMAKLRKAFDLIQAVLLAGEVPEPPPQESKTLTDRYGVAAEEATTETVLISGSAPLSGLVIQGNLDSIDNADIVLKSLGDFFTEHGYTLELPSASGFKSGARGISIYLPATDNDSDLLEEVIGKAADSGVKDVTFSALPFYGVESKSFDQAFLGK